MPSENSVTGHYLSNVDKTPTHSCFAVKTKGFSHIKKGSNCQDEFRCQSVNIKRKDVIIAALADGHGSEKYHLSEFGARFAVNWMFAILKFYCNKYNGINDLYTAVKEDFPAKLYQKWCESVEKDYAERNPESESEEKGEIHKKYGTTAMFCLVIENAFIFGKMDGNVTVYKNNEYFEPNKDDDNLIGTEAYSLSKKDNALNNWSVGITYDADFLTLSTDGLRMSFGEDDNPKLFYSAISEIYNYICKHGEVAARDSLPAFLNRCSKDGSADDITICCIKSNVSDKNELEYRTKNDL